MRMCSITVRYLTRDTVLVLPVLPRWGPQRRHHVPAVVPHFCQKHPLPPKSRPWTALPNPGCLPVCSASSARSPLPDKCRLAPAPSVDSASHRKPAMTDLQRRQGLGEGSDLPVAVLATLGDSPPPLYPAPPNGPLTFTGGSRKKTPSGRPAAGHCHAPPSWFMTEISFSFSSKEISFSSKETSFSSKETSFSSRRSSPRRRSPSISFDLIFPTSTAPAPHPVPPRARPPPQQRRAFPLALASRAQGPPGRAAALALGPATRCRPRACRCVRVGGATVRRPRGDAVAAPPSSRCRPGPTTATAAIANDAVASPPLLLLPPRPDRYHRRHRDVVEAPPPRTSPRARRRRHCTPSAP